MVEKIVKGRGVGFNPANRFEPISFEPDPEWNPEEDPSPKTRFYRDQTRDVLSKNDSPDIGFTYGLNPYRGCEHGCVYCYARPTHEYLGLSAGLDFETKIFVKEDAPSLLRERLASPRWVPQTVVMSGVTDCYQTAEKRFALTRGCLEVFAEFLNPVAIITKNRLVTRDIDVLKKLARADAAAVILSVTSLEDKVRRVMEPRTSAPKERLAAIHALSEAGIPVGVNVAPVVPGLTDHELPRILYEAAKAGARFAGYVPLRLPFAVKNIFEEWLAQNFPDHQKKVLNQIRAIRGGNLNDARFGSRMRGQGVFAKNLEEMFRIACGKAGLQHGGPGLSARSFHRREEQLSLNL